MTFIERTLGKTAQNIISGKESARLLLEVALGAQSASTGSSSTSSTSSSSTGPANAEQMISNKIEKAEKTQELNTGVYEAPKPSLGKPEAQTRSDVNTGYTDMHYQAPSDTKPTTDDTVNVAKMLRSAIDRVNT